MKTWEIIVFTILCSSLIGFAGYVQGYKNGQVDALNGKFSYQYSTQTNIVVITK